MKKSMYIKIPMMAAAVLLAGEVNADTCRSYIEHRTHMGRMLEIKHVCKEESRDITAERLAKQYHAGQKSELEERFHEHREYHSNKTALDKTSSENAIKRKSLDEIEAAHTQEKSHVESELDKLLKAKKALDKKYPYADTPNTELNHQLKIAAADLQKYKELSHSFKECLKTLDKTIEEIEDAAKNYKDK